MLESYCMDERHEPTLRWLVKMDKHWDEAQSNRRYKDIERDCENVVERVCFVYGN